MTMRAVSFARRKGPARRGWGAALALALASAPLPLAAQVATPGIGGPGTMTGAPAPGPAGSNPSDKDKASNALAPALPGAVTTSDSIAPPTKPASEMSPNDELFDAIERGDIQAVRDALSRGASLEARDVLGETPIELAIDLGRHAITFTLLSMRGTGEGDVPPPPAVAAAASPGAASEKSAGTKNGPRQARIVSVSTAASPLAGVAGGALASASAFTGRPDPANGFLGFAPLVR
jgi:hypothetical protein